MRPNQVKLLVIKNVIKQMNIQATDVERTVE